jgi:hypothetical protein
MDEDQPGNLLDYSVYLLDARGRIQTMQRLTATSDEGAIWMLARLEFSHAAELWRRGRRIASVGSMASGCAEPAAVPGGGL